MTIAIIGTGNMGNALARALAAARFEIAIGHREPAKAAALAAEIGPAAQGGGIAAAMALADTAFLTVPYGAMAEVIRAAGDLSGKTLVDVSNPISPDASGVHRGRCGTGEGNGERDRSRPGVRARGRRILEQQPLP